MRKTSPLRTHEEGWSADDSFFCLFRALLCAVAKIIGEIALENAAGSSRGACRPARRRASPSTQSDPVHPSPDGPFLRGIFLVKLPSATPVRTRGGYAARVGSPDKAARPSPFSTSKRHAFPRTLPISHPRRAYPPGARRVVSCISEAYTPRGGCRKLRRQEVKFATLGKVLISRRLETAWRWRTEPACTRLRMETRQSGAIKETCQGNATFPRNRL